MNCPAPPQHYYDNRVIGDVDIGGRDMKGLKCVH